MPIIDVEIIIRPSEMPRRGLALAIANAADGALGSPEDTTHVKLHTIEAEHYAESGIAASTSSLPVFVSILGSGGHSPAELGLQAQVLAESIADACGRKKENIHILFLPSTSGRLL
jgi:phenylpyruvate tautomerase PptA (4-oxalocrotonate tautomerase family)